MQNIYSSKEKYHHLGLIDLLSQPDNMEYKNNTGQTQL